MPGRSDSRANSFRWTGPGSIHILERGMLVMTRRRSPLGFRTADERFVSAAQICEVCREGDSVRVDLRDGEFFQFWTGNPAAAGTIVRLLPTTRTIEYEGAAGEPTPPSRPLLSLQRRRRARRRLLSVAILAGLVAVGVLLVTDIALRRAPAPVATPAVVATSPPVSTAVSAQPQARRDEVTSVLAEIRHFDERMDGLRAQYRTASLALQWGQMSRDDFTAGINKWFVPQWRALYRELAAKPHDDDSLTSLVRKRLIAATLGWERGLQDYADGLRTNEYDAVVAAFGRMSDGNESRRDAWRIVERAEFNLAPTSSTPRRP